MNNFLKEINSKLKSIYTFVTKDSKVFWVVKGTLIVSTITLVVFLYLKSRNRRLVLAFSQNLGYLRLIKPDVYHYGKLMNSKEDNKYVIDKFFKKFYAYPNGITNYGNNCYINVLMQVKIIYLVFSQQSRFYFIYKGIS